jgi:hypothetical protein
MRLKIKQKKKNKNQTNKKYYVKFEVSTATALMIQSSVSSRYVAGLIFPVVLKNVIPSS